jgi:hypothetical protein
MSWFSFDSPFWIRKFMDPLNPRRRAAFTEHHACADEVIDQLTAQPQRKSETYNYSLRLSNRLSTDYFRQWKNNRFLKPPWYILWRRKRFIRQCAPSYAWSSRTASEDTVCYLTHEDQRRTALHACAGTYAIPVRPTNTLLRRNMLAS